MRRARSIADLLIDPADLRITDVVIEFGGRARAVPIAHLGVRSEEDEPIPLRLTPAEIEALPEVVASPSEDVGDRS